MKHTLALINLTALLLFLFFAGCKKDEKLVHLTDFERSIYNAVNKYRQSKSLPSITLQFLMINDAQSYSKRMSTGAVSYGVDDVMGSLNTLKINLGGDAHGAVVQFSEIENADTVVNRMVRDPVKREIIEKDFNQTAVGAAKDKSGNWYVTQLFLHIP